MLEIETTKTCTLNFNIFKRKIHSFIITTIISHVLTKLAAKSQLYICLKLPQPSNQRKKNSVSESLTR